MKKKYKWFLGIIFSVVFIKMTFPLFGEHTKPARNEYPLTAISARILATEADLLGSRYGMVCCGKGRSTFEKLDHLSLDFDFPKKLTKDEGRAIVLDCVHEIIQHVNANLEVQPYLLKNGFNETNVKVAIFCHNNGTVFYPDIGTFSFYMGKMHYGSHDKENPRGPYFSYEKELYEDSIAILKQQRRTDVLLK